jgi:hypothetical protein
MVVRAERRGNCVALSERQIRAARLDYEIISRLQNLHIGEKKKREPEFLTTYL